MTHEKSEQLAAIQSAYPKNKRLTKPNEPTTQEQFLKLKKAKHFVSLYVSEMAGLTKCQKQFLDKNSVRISALITTFQMVNQKLMSQQGNQPNLVYLLRYYFITLKITLQ